jgi:Rieske Fe-S protein
MSEEAREADQGKENVRNPGRRKLLLWAGAALDGVAGVLLAIPLVGYVFSSFSSAKDPRKWIALGEVNNFAEGRTQIAVYRNPVTRPWDGDTADIPCWVRRLKSNQFQVFAINCAHLGCPVRWFQESGLFLCPCHGGVYYEDGSRASGPPPRGLFEYDYKVENGQLWIRGGEMPTLANPA